MILTKKFVFIHLRKTGGTFVSTVMGRVYRERGWWPRVRNRLSGKRFLSVNQHGTCAEIPPSHRGLPILSSVRNPFDRLVSMYHFKGWQRNPEQWFADHAALAKRFPSFPDLTFEEFADAATETFKGLDDSSVPPADRLGCQSEELVRYFWREPARVFPTIDDAYIAERRFERDMHPVRWIRMENLNGDVHDALRGFGEPAERIAFILEEGRILPAQSAKAPRRDRDWRSAYTPELLARIRRRERLLLALFPEYDVGGGPPPPPKYNCLLKRTPPPGAPRAGGPPPPLAGGGGAPPPR